MKKSQSQNFGPRKITITIKKPLDLLKIEINEFYEKMKKGDAKISLYLPKAILHSYEWNFEKKVMVMKSKDPNMYRNRVLRSETENVERVREIINNFIPFLLDVDENDIC